MDKKFFSGIVFGLFLGISLSFATPIISQPINIKIDGKNTSTSNKSKSPTTSSYTTKSNDKSDESNAKLNENLEKILSELKELNDKNKEAIKYLRNIDNNTKFQNPYGASTGNN